MQNFVFQDNIYHLARSIDVLYEGLQLNLDECLYAEKVVYDVRFLTMRCKSCARISIASLTSPITYQFFIAYSPAVHDS